MSRLLVIAEDDALNRIVTALVDRKLTEIDWAVDHELESLRTWLKPAQRRYFKKGDFNVDRFRVHGRAFGGVSGAQQAIPTRKLLLAVEDSPHRPDAVILAFDVDRDWERVIGFALARDNYTWRFHVALALPNPEAEAWFIVALWAAGRITPELQAQLNTSLGFEPWLAPERLTSTSGDATRDCKNVWASIERAVEHAEHDALAAPWEQLSAATAESHLPEFLQELDELTRACFGRR